MKNEIINDKVPEQNKGAQSNTEHSVTAKNREVAIGLFKRASKRLLNINIWHKLSGLGTGEFVLENSQGNEEHRLAEVNDYFQINLPGPGSVAGGGYDWVKVEKIEDNSNSEGEEESLSLTVRPSSNPNTAGTDTAHFFTDDATSTFIVRREGNKVTAGVYGRNEKPNADTGNVIDKVRNIAMGATAIAGVAKIQWGMLVKGLLSDEVQD